MRAPQSIIQGFVVLLGIVVLTYAALIVVTPPVDTMPFGVSFDPVYTEYLGLNVTSTFTRLVTDAGFKHVRIGVAWDSVEPASGTYNFKQFDELMQIAAANKAKVVLAVGQKTPRWPECHLPEWAAKLAARAGHQIGSLPSDYKNSLHRYLGAVVNHFKGAPALELWQVENEPFLKFGVCPLMTENDLAEEIALVRTLDKRHGILVTDSGELSTWRKTATAGDYFGTTLYRVVWNKHVGYLQYNWVPAAIYQLKLSLNGLPRSKAMVAELQAEPWMPDQDVTETPFAEQFKSLSLDQLKSNVDYAKRVGFGRSYLWGAEWWVWAASKGHPEFYEYIKGLQKE